MNSQSHLLMFPVLVCLALTVRAQGTAMEPVKDHAQVCQLWESRVDSKMKIKEGAALKGKPMASASSHVPNMALPPNGGVTSDPDGVKELSEQEAFDAISCLLNMENNVHQSRFGTYVQPQVSQFFAPAPSNLAALYYISYIYTGDWQHAGAVALRGQGVEAFNSRGEYLTRSEAVAAAYKAYRKWFAEVKRIGLQKSREAGLNPLSETGMEWYGPVRPLKPQ